MHGKNIPVNSVDSLDYCSFIFPAYVKKGDIVIGISTSGKAPALFSALKEILYQYHNKITLIEPL